MEGPQGDVDVFEFVRRRASSGNDPGNFKQQLASAMSLTYRKESRRPKNFHPHALTKFNRTDPKLTLTQ
jgi:hypothetical protein